MHGECGMLGDSVDVVYAATSDSDSWIEREVLLLRADGCPKVWVATSDSFHQQAAHGSVCELLTFSFKQRFALKDINL
jgi:predicted RNA-binding protein with PIN domain